MPTQQTQPSSLIRKKHQAYTLLTFMYQFHWSRCRGMAEEQPRSVVTMHVTNLRISHSRLMHQQASSFLSFILFIGAFFQCLFAAFLDILASILYTCWYIVTAAAELPLPKFWCEGVTGGRI